MNIEQVRELCLAVHPAVTEDIPFAKFDYDDVAFRIAGKIFAFLLVDDSRMVVLKCDPDLAVELREAYPAAVEPAFHWNKKYWNQVHYDHPSLSPDSIHELITHSFTQVVGKLPRRTRASLGLLTF